jgi:general secretion pathway protein G
MKRNAFTMIELVFVIVIIGILTAIAVPKFLAVRDSANSAKEVANLRTGINDVASQYLLTGSSVGLPTFASFNINCFDYNISTDGNMTISDINTSGYCLQAINDANNSHLLDSRKF